MANKPENLKPFPKGVSGNPAGKPKGTVSLKTKLKKALQAVWDNTNTPADDMLIKNMISSAIKEDGQSRRMIWQYIEGMPKETKDVNVNLPKPITEINNAILQDNSNKEDNGDDKEDKSSTGRDISEQDNINSDLPDSTSTD